MASLISSSSKDKVIIKPYQRSWRIFFISYDSQLSESKKMDEDFVRDARKGKAKLEDDDQISLPPSTTPKTHSNSGDDLISLKIVGPTRDQEAVEATSQLSESKKVDEEFVRDARKGKAILEDEHQISLPPIPQFQSNLGFDTIYLKIIATSVECINEIRRLRENEAVESDSPESLMKIQFRFRSREMNKILGKDDERVTNIHTVSGATIGILSNTAANIHRQLYLELLGTADQVKIAEILISDAITDDYERPYIPKPLMPINICHHSITVLLSQVAALLGHNNTTLLQMESESGTWIEVNTYHPDVNVSERVVNIYGEGLDVSKAILMIKDKISEYERSSTLMKDALVEDEFLEDEFLEEFKEDDDDGF
ncbi:hypothetical protein LXL04_017265 [Taraxacum kok-saghyz]